MATGSKPPLALLARHDPLIRAFLNEAAPLPLWTTNYVLLPAARLILESMPAERVSLLLDAMKALETAQALMGSLRSNHTNDPTWKAGYALRALVTRLLMPALPFDERSMTMLLGFAAASYSIWVSLPLGSVIRAAERYGGGKDGKMLNEGHRVLLRSLLGLINRQNTKSNRRLTHRVNVLLGEANNEKASRPIIESGEPWADAALAEFNAMNDADQNHWRELLTHAELTTSSAPSKKWLKTATALIDTVGRANFFARTGNWLPLVGKPGPGRPMRGYTDNVLDPTVLSDQNADVLKGLAWFLSTTDDPQAATLLGNLAEVCFKKIPMHGARSPKVANAAVIALSLMSGSAVAQLTRIGGKVKKPSARKTVEKALNKSALNQNLSRAELEEISIPDLGFALDGTRRWQLGAWTAEVRIQNSLEVALKWTKALGKSQASIPVEAKRDHAGAVKEVRWFVKDASQLLNATTTRIERLYTANRSWSMNVFHQRYLDHPLVAPIARRLIWQIDLPNTSALIADGDRWLNSSGQTVDVDTAAAVRLWHPISAAPEEVECWRSFLMSRSVVQPFKQAFREVYLLTDAERATDTYSNRFAAHILRQHQFQALCDARRWTYKLMGNFDSQSIPTRALTDDGLIAEFWVEPAPPDVSPSGIYLYVSTDQIRFQRVGEQLPLAQIPPILLSEILRDVDLFVGVASVGNDPTWQDGGPGGRYQTYWQGYSFGDLSATAQTRRDVLSRLVPRLKIADRCSLTDKFLVVRGSLRTYKIHLGSGNILMEPNDQYLCIVPARSAVNPGSQVFLPFEGDSTLSVILSKAFLLAADDKIADSTITRQIKGG